MGKRHPLEVFRDARNQGTPNKKSKSSGIGSSLGGFLGGSKNTEPSFLDKVLDKIPKGTSSAGGSSGQKKKASQGRGPGKKKGPRGAPLANFYPLILAGGGAILVLVLAGFVGYKIGFVSGQEAAGLTGPSTSDGKQAPGLSSEWRDPSDSLAITPSPKGEDEQLESDQSSGSDIPYRVLVYEFTADLSGSGSSARRWQEILISEGFSEVELAQDEKNTLLLFCGKASREADLAGILQRIRSFPDGEGTLRFRDAEVIQIALGEG